LKVTKELKNMLSPLLKKIPRIEFLAEKRGTVNSFANINLKTLCVSGGKEIIDFA
jgi:hypothetical protein